MGLPSAFLHLKYHELVRLVQGLNMWPETQVPQPLPTKPNPWSGNFPTYGDQSQWTRILQDNSVYAIIVPPTASLKAPTQCKPSSDLPTYKNGSRVCLFLTGLDKISIYLSLQNLGNSQGKQVQRNFKMLAVCP